MCHFLDNLLISKISLFLTLAKRQIETREDSRMDNKRSAQGLGGISAGIRDPAHQEQYVWNGLRPQLRAVVHGPLAQAGPHD